MKLKSQSAKICLNFNFRLGGGGYSETEKSKCQDLPKFQFFWGGGYSETEKSKCQDLPKFQFSDGGGVFPSKLWSGRFGPKFTVRPETCLCITVVSHILRMWRLMKISPFAASARAANSTADTISFKCTAVSVH